MKLEDIIATGRRWGFFPEPPAGKGIRTLWFLSPIKKPANRRVVATVTVDEETLADRTKFAAIMRDARAGMRRYHRMNPAAAT
jgi:hypothetical protein